MVNLANFLTVLRLLLLPLILVLMFTPGAWAAWLALVLYAIGAISDFFDGWMARKYNQVTPFGTFMDPISDKIYVAALLVALVGAGQLSGIWIALPIIILTREFLVSGLREFLGPKDVQVPVTKLAKWKTASQMFALGFLIVAFHVPYALAAGQLLLALATVLTVITGWQYSKAGWVHLK